VRFSMGRIPAALVVLMGIPGFGAVSSWAQTPPRIVYTFNHPQLQPAQYTITIDETGAVHFVSEPGPAQADDADGVSPAPMDRQIQLDDSLRGNLFSYARTHDFFNRNCARTGLAFTGNKTLTYTGSDGHGSCAFVWALDPPLQRLADQLNAVAFTLEEGRRLDVELQHDRLGLDAELQSLQGAVKEQRAADLANIASELQAIAGDDQVMERARKQAQALLSHSETPLKRN
jgi:hypothetical protein